MAMTALAIGAVAAPVIGGIMGNMASSGERAAAEAAYARAYSQFANLNIPEIEKQKLALEAPEVQGILQPYMQAAEQMGPSGMENINIDPRLKQAQMNALDTLSKMGADGLTAEDRMQLNAARRQVAGDEQARQASIMQSMQQRGVGGGGAELAARLQASQEAADRQAQESDRLMAMAQNRMLQAVSQAGQLGGSIRGQEFGEQADVARAKDAIAQFNASQRAQTQASNVGALNQAQAGNLSEKQRIADAGTATRNAEQQFNKGLLQQKYQNEMQLAQARANAAVGQAQVAGQNADRIANQWSGIGSGVGTGLMGAATLYGKQQAATPGTTVAADDPSKLPPNKSSGGFY